MTHMTLHAFGSIVASLVILAGCSSDPNQSALLKQTFNKSAPLEPSATFLALQNSGAPTYVAGLQNKKDAYTLFVRQTVNAKDEETWISPDHLSLGMKNGMIIATRGFGNDIYAADVGGTLSALQKDDEVSITEHFITPLSGSSQVERLAFRCQVTHQSREPVSLSESYTADTDLFYETCRNGRMNFQNLFWVERKTKRIVQSRQWINEETGELALRLIVE
ncbi:YjbF family lipoprotein [Celeribacter halophilus]|uniref:YjbF family lipoprotein n=1 Tax=Celeribacter halophilus TaxID=576117 RepID=UPI001C086B27|nr:YjbF family lipoprotein [Celeribacter halophilus]MBU2888852.1 YjbF family lipoprotein [Celeribacter halophilus]MDO6511970.1 YjbF family lipoprotein [Celeribacter halophilus]